MGIASSMKELTQNIALSHEDRTEALKQIKGEVKNITGGAQTMIKGLQTSRRKAGARLRNNLAQDQAKRKSDVQSLLGDTQGLVKGFGASRKKGGAKLRKDLAENAAERKSEVNEILKDAQQTIAAAQSQRKEAGTNLREKLAQSRLKSKSEVGELLKGAENVVRDMGRSRKESGNKLRKDLAESRTHRASAMNKMRGEFHKSQTKVRAEISGAGKAWQELHHSTVAKKVKEIPNLEAKLLAVVNEHPNGISLTEVAGSFGVAPIIFGRASKRLLDEGKIHREDKLYFPVTG